MLQKEFIKPEDREPEIHGFEFWFDAFRELGSCRVNGMGLGPIPFTAIVEYSRIYDVGDFDEFRYVIRIMDDKILELENARSKSGEKNGRSTDDRKAN